MKASAYYKKNLKLCKELRTSIIEEIEMMKSSSAYLSTDIKSMRQSIKNVDKLITYYENSLKTACVLEKFHITKKVEPENL